MLQPSVPKGVFGMAANQNLISSNPILPFRSANRGSFLEQTGGSTVAPRHSFNEFSANAEALLNSGMPRPPNMLVHGPGISELLQNQMPSHKMSIDFTSRENPK